MRKGVKHTYYLSTLSISLVLFLLGVVLYLGYMVETTSKKVVGEIKISALVKNNTKKDSVDKLIDDLKNSGVVESVEYISKEQAAEIYKRSTGEDFTLFIDENPLPASIDVKFVADSITTERLDAVCKELEENSSISEVLRSQEVVDKVLGYVYKTKLFIYSFIIVLLFISIILINNAIKLTIRSKRFIIRSMKLIGATDSFIRKPLVVKSIGQGILASFIAWIMFLLLFVLVSNGSIDLIMSKETLIEVGSIFAIILIIGVTISVVCTTKAVNRQLIENNNDLHTY